MQVEYAVAMTIEQIKEHNTYLTNLYTKKKYSSSHVLEVDKQKLINFYHEMEARIKEDNLKYKKEHLKIMLAVDFDRCICGSDLQEEAGVYGSYMSCKNKSNKSVSHKNYVSYKRNNYPLPKLYQSDIPKRYLFDIIKDNGYKNTLNAKALLSFYLENGLPDLKEKYLDISSSKHINTYIEVKKIADAFENECVTMLQNLYTTVKPQFHIKYKLKDGKPNQVAKLDIVCSNDKEVVVFECKTNSSDKDDEQKQRYLALINFINTTDRKVSFHYLIDNERDCEGFKFIGSSNSKK